MYDSKTIDIQTCLQKINSWYNSSHSSSPTMFSVLKSHLRAVQFASTVTIVTAGLIALPSRAEEPSLENGTGYYANYIATRFQRIGATQVGTYDNTSIATSAFDFAQYVSHTCYHPTENDIPGCKHEFGPFFNLKDTLTNGTLVLILKRFPSYAGAERFAMPEHLSTTILREAEPSPQPLIQEQVMQQNRDERARLSWDQCQNHFDSRRDAVACYQRNIRLVSMHAYNVPTDEILQNVR